MHLWPEYLSWTSTAGVERQQAGGRWLHRTLLVMASRMHRMSAHIWAASQTDLLDGWQARRQR
jgi:hypothetical protein